MHSSSGPRAASTKSRRPGKQVIVWFWILGFCLAALVATYVMFVEPPPPRKIVIASGSQNGAYFRYAQEYAEELQEGRPVRRGARDGGLGGKPAPAGAGRLGRGGRHRSERRGEPRGGDSTFMPWAACTTSPCGSSTAATSRSSASVSSRASASVSVRRAAAPTRSPCGCWPSTA